MIVISCKETLEALSKIKSALGKEFNTVSVNFEKNYMNIGSAGSNLSLSIKVPNSYGKGSFAINAESFQKILNNRSIIDAKLKKDVLSFSSKNYQGKLSVLPYMKIVVEPEEKGVIKIPHNSGIVKHFNEARQSLKLTDPLDSSKDSFLCVKISNGEILCAVYDSIHAGVYKEKLEYPEEIRFNILDATLSKVLSLTKNENSYDMTIGKSSVFIESENIKASLLMQQIDAESFDKLIDMTNNIQSQIVVSCLIQSEDILNTVENMMGIIEVSKEIHVQMGKDSLHLEYMTSFGRISETFNTETKGETNKVKLTPEVLLDLCKNFPSDKIKFSIAQIETRNRKMKQIVFKVKPFVYIMSTL